MRCDLCKIATVQNTLMPGQGHSYDRTLQPQLKSLAREARWIEVAIPMGTETRILDICPACQNLTRIIIYAMQRLGTFPMDAPPIKGSE